MNWITRIKTAYKISILVFKILKKTLDNAKKSELVKQLKKEIEQLL